MFPRSYFVSDFIFLPILHYIFISLMQYLFCCAKMRISYIGIRKINVSKLHHYKNHGLSCTDIFACTTYEILNYYNLKSIQHKVTAIKLKLSSSINFSAQNKYVARNCLSILKYS